jgi:hypothetical protein
MIREINLTKEITRELFLADRVKAGVVRCCMSWVDGEKRQDGARQPEGAGGRVSKIEAGKGLKVETKVAPDAYRMVELEMENLRLTQLVADLLLKNQQLRESN